MKTDVSRVSAIIASITEITGSLFPEGRDLSF